MLSKEEILKDLYRYNSKHQKDGFTLFSLFGSYARGTQDFFSDIDLTYTINHKIFYENDAFAKLSKINEIQKELQQIFHKKIDLIPANTSNKIIQTTLQKEQIII